MRFVHLKSVLSVYGTINWSHGMGINRFFIAKDKDIIRVQDTIDQNGLLLLWSDAQDKYTLNSSLILNWQGLTTNIPPKWKSMLSSGHTELLRLKAMVEQRTR